MEITREHFRAMIFYDFRKGLTRQQCFKSIRSVFGNEAPCQKTIYNWFSEFQRGRTSFSDEHREGRPATAVVPENVDAVREMIMADRHTTYHEIRASLGIGMSQIKTILHKHLTVRKLCSRWIPHNLTEVQKKARVTWSLAMLKRFAGGSSNLVWNIVTGDETWIYCYEPETKNQSTVWVFSHEPKPTKVIRSRSVGKRMIACFFGKSGHVATIPLVERKSINAEWYTTICLPKVVEEVRKTNRRRRILLHQDNASSHTARMTTAYLKEKNVELVDHPPYSPDLSPCDYFLFPKIKTKLRGQRFQTPDEAVEAYKNLVSEMPVSEWHKCFETWFARMKKCVDANGEYFEKQ